MLRAAPSKWKFIFKSQAVNYATGWGEQLVFCWWREEACVWYRSGKEGARDIQGGLAQKVRLIKWGDVTKSLSSHTYRLQIPWHTQGVIRKQIIKMAESPLPSAWKDNCQSNQTSHYWFQGRIETASNSWLFKEARSRKRKAQLFLGLAINGPMLYPCYWPDIAGCQRLNTQDIPYVFKKPIMDRHLCDDSTWYGQYTHRALKTVRSQPRALVLNLPTSVTL